MPRKGSVPKRDVLPDPVYHSKTVAKFINKVMLSGKKSVAQRVVYDAFETIKEKTGKDPLEVFETALKNVMPVLEVRARRVGGMNSASSSFIKSFAVIEKTMLKIYRTAANSLLNAVNVQPFFFM